MRHAHEAPHRLLLAPQRQAESEVIDSGCTALVPLDSSALQFFRDRGLIWQHRLIFGRENLIRQVAQRVVRFGCTFFGTQNEANWS
ncbi:hypothetical protein WS71_22460 [Burkholderia mayonis]|uniref:Uncharacterized protein n=1 Tax=Burkholderia mayonis TaxID=1385591 RepID=A0A1B4G263_9BURK|nr:hypothetical protein WS71_22460 [Burkholderia mayonis]KVE49054.1 hypothetical protein WS71_17370 [Burkholderia mayonis]